jgi:hypothetical protein
MGTPGAEFLSGLRTNRFGTIWRKGYDCDNEAYALTACVTGYCSYSVLMLDFATA